MNSVNQAWSGKRAAKIAGSAIAMQAAAWAILWLVFGVAKLGYSWFAFADSTYYFEIAGKLASGLVPYRDFALEYPPLFVPLAAIPRALADMPQYVFQFAVLMVVFMAAAAAFTALTAYAQDTGDARRPYVVGALFALTILASGSIVANRYDAAVALVFAACMLTLVQGRWEVAAAVLGLGFALKITPIFVLPMILILAPRRRVAWSMAWFSLTAVVPFLAFLLSGGGALTGLIEMLKYHVARPLEIESVLGAPLLVSGLNGLIPINIFTAYGSQNIGAPGAEFLARSSVFLVLGGLGFTFWLTWRRRDAIRSDARIIPFALLVAMLVSMVFSKVFSPQYFIWTLPAVALVAVDRKALGALLFGAIVLTHVEFPANYAAFLMGNVAAVSVVVARNVLVLAAMVVGLWQLWKLPVAVVAPDVIEQKGGKRSSAGR